MSNLESIIIRDYVSGEITEEFREYPIPNSRFVVTRISDEEMYSYTLEEIEEIKDFCELVISKHAKEECMEDSHA